MEPYHLLPTSLNTMVLYQEQEPEVLQTQQPDSLAILRIWQQWQYL